MITFLFDILIVLIIVYVAHLLINMLKIPGEIKTIAYLFVGICALMWLLTSLGLYHPPFLAR